MNTTFDYLTGNRKWLVRDFSIWGDIGAIDGAILFTESDSPSARVSFVYELSGGSPQVVEFADLVDHRGNCLPSSIANAEILIIPKNEIGSFIVGSVGPSSFRVAREPAAPSDAQVDLLIMEMN